MTTQAARRKPSDILFNYRDAANARAQAESGKHKAREEAARILEEAEKVCHDTAHRLHTARQEVLDLFTSTGHTVIATGLSTFVAQRPRPDAPATNFVVHEKAFKFAFELDKEAEEAEAAARSLPTEDEEPEDEAADEDDPALRIEAAPFDEGAQAFRDGRDAKANPYGLDPDAFLEWANGYAKAKADAETREADASIRITGGSIYLGRPIPALTQRQAIDGTGERFPA